MAHKIWSAAELEQMTPAERDAIFEASIITDLNDAPPELLQRTRRRVEQIIADAERSQPG
jgi:hypothetical protein